MAIVFLGLNTAKDAEVAAPSYRRMKMEMKADPDGCVCRNVHHVEFPIRGPSGGSWGPFPYLSIWDAEIDGRRLACIPLRLSPVNLSVTDTLHFASGSVAMFVKDLP